MDELLLNRALHPSDYDHPQLAPYISSLIRFRDEVVKSAPYLYRDDHPHRVWEYAEVVRKLNFFGFPYGARILDVGFGCSWFTQYLARAYYEVTATDDESFAPVRGLFAKQCEQLGTDFPLIIAPIENQAVIPDNLFNATLCISVIEHVQPEKFEAAWSELARVTAVNGYVFITSDYFRDHLHWQKSIALACQRNPFWPSCMDYTLELARSVGLELVGEADWAYCGDFVNNYNFISLTFRKVG